MSIGHIITNIFQFYFVSVVWNLKEQESLVSSSILAKRSCADYLKRKQVTMMSVKLLLDIITKTNQSIHHAVQLSVLVMVCISKEGSQKSCNTARELFYGINGISIIAVLCKLNRKTSNLINHTQPGVAIEIISVYRVLKLHSNILICRSA